MASAPHSSPPPPDLSWGAKGITGLTVHIGSSAQPQNDLQRDSQYGEIRPSRWRTSEFALYAVVLMIAVLYMVISTVELSQRECFFNNPFFNMRS